MKLSTTLTAGPWALRGYQVRAENGLGKHIATYQTGEADGRVLAASRQLLDILVGIADGSREEGAGGMGARGIREFVRRRLIELKLAEPDVVEENVGTPEQREQDAYGRWQRGSRAQDPDRKAAFEAGCICHYLEGDFHHHFTCPAYPTGDDT